MKIAYDISVLGQGYVNPKARTGIYRVIESLFLELITHFQVKTAEYYITSVLPGTLGKMVAIENGSSSVVDISDAAFGGM